MCDAPPIDSCGVLFALDDFWSHVLNGADETIGTRLAVEHVPFAQSKVCHFDVSISIQQDVLRLQITMNNALAVKETNSRN